MPQRLYYFLESLGSAKSSSENPPIDSRHWVERIEDANLISSLCDDGRHMPVLDVDHMSVWDAVGAVYDCLLPDQRDRLLDAVQIVPSSTPGHFHLYLNLPMSWEEQADLLRQLCERKVIEPGYYRASLARQATYVRCPHVRKPQVVSA